MTHQTRIPASIPFGRYPIERVDGDTQVRFLSGGLNSSLSSVWAEHSSDTRRVIGSNPIGTTLSSRSAAVSAPVLHTGGRRFESYREHISMRMWRRESHGAEAKRI